MDEEYFLESYGDIYCMWLEKCGLLDDYGWETETACDHNLHIVFEDYSCECFDCDVAQSCLEGLAEMSCDGPGVSGIDACITSDLCDRCDTAS